MRPTYRGDPAQGILVVSCVPVVADAIMRMAEDYSFSKNATDAETLFARNTFDCVVTIVDPSNEDSFKQLRRVVNAARNGGVPVVTTAEFNPDWIDNLVSQFGSTAHFREFPTTAQLDEFTRSFSAERRAAMERTSI